MVKSLSLDKDKVLKNDIIELYIKIKFEDTYMISSIVVWKGIFNYNMSSKWEDVGLTPPLKRYSLDSPPSG